MQSAILVEPKRIELQDVGVPSAPEGGMVVRVRTALTDGTDLKAYRRGHPRMPMPTPFGHEFAGDVAATGRGCSKFREGDAVMSVHTAPCGVCYWCRHGEEELCESIMSTMILGAYAQYIVVPARIVERNAYAKPPELSYTAAAFLEPFSCVVHSIDFLGPREGDVVLVVGDGGFGLLHGLLLARSGAVPVLAGRRSERLALAAEFGIERTVNVRTSDLRSMLDGFTGGRGADALIECTGSADVWESAPSFVRRGGAVSFFGGLPAETAVSFPAARLHYDEVRLMSPFHFRPASVRRAYELLTSGAVDPVPLVTETVPLREIARVFERLDNGEGIKFAIEP